MILDLFIYFFSFLFIWYGSGLIIGSIDRLAHRFKISSFAASFFVLGILTSLPEATIGVNAVIEAEPEIFVGNLIGASLVLFVLVIPILAVFGNGVTLNHQLNEKNLFLSLIIVAAPIFFIIDQKITRYEGLFLIILYLVLFYMIEKRKGLIERIHDEIIYGKGQVFRDIGKIIVGILIVFVSSGFIVDKTRSFSQTLGISSYIVSLLFLSIGTNLPELSLAIRAINMGKKNVALGDYIGSAAANTLIFGLLTFFYGKTITVTNHFLLTLIFIVLGFGLFFLFSRSKNDISRREGTALLFLYLLFLITEIVI